MEPLFSKPRLWIWPLLYLVFPWLLGLFSERFRDRWSEEWWLQSYARSETLSIDKFALQILQPIWPLGQVADQRIRTLVEGKQAHPDQMAWLTGRILQMKGLHVSWVHADGHAYSFLEVVNHQDTFCLDPFYGVRWVGPADDYIFHENFQKEAFHRNGGQGHAYLAFHPNPNLKKVAFAPESLWIKGLSKIYGWWPWLGLDRLWLGIWSNLP